MYISIYLLLSWKIGVSVLFRPKREYTCIMKYYYNITYVYVRLCGTCVHVHVFVCVCVCVSVCVRGNCMTLFNKSSECPVNVNCIQSLQTMYMYLDSRTRVVRIS